MIQVAELPTEEEAAARCRLEMLLPMAERDHLLASRVTESQRLRLVFSLARQAFVRIGAGEVFDAELTFDRCTTLAAAAAQTPAEDADPAEWRRKCGIVRLAMHANEAVARGLGGNVLAAARMLLGVLRALADLDRCGDPDCATVLVTTHLQVSLVMLRLCAWGHAWHHASRAAELTADGLDSRLFQCVLLTAVIVRHLAGALLGGAAAKGVLCLHGVALPVVMASLPDLDQIRADRLLAEVSFAAAECAEMMSRSARPAPFAPHNIPRQAGGMLESFAAAVVGVVGKGSHDTTFGLTACVAAGPANSESVSPLSELWTVWADAAQPVTIDPSPHRPPPLPHPLPGGRSDEPHCPPLDDTVLEAMAAWGCRDGARPPTAPEEGPVVRVLLPEECVLVSIPECVDASGHYVLAGGEWRHRHRRRYYVRAAADGCWEVVNDAALTTKDSVVMRSGAPHASCLPHMLPPDEWKSKSPDGWVVGSAAVTTAAAYEMGGDDQGLSALVRWLYDSRTAAQSGILPIRADLTKALSFGDTVGADEASVGGAGILESLGVEIGGDDGPGWAYSLSE